jgi:hypothetical protein
VLMHAIIDDDGACLVHLTIDFPGAVHVFWW